MDTKYQAKLFLFDLQNAAEEHWFKPGEHWELRLADSREKSASEKTYHPVIAMEGTIQEMKALFARVYELLYPGRTAPDDDRVYKENEVMFCLAYNISRVRK